ncbi:MAG TPA: ABC transporter ATP-binding protein [Myxococcota bacterium]|jgi:ABC-type multidrug transport system fused ATPase/permease subunit
MSAPPAAGRRLGERETLRLFARALRYVSPLRWRFAGKLGLTLASLAPRLLLPWPAKLIIDHVINRDPITAALAGYPLFVQTVLAPLAGMEPLAILLWLLGAQGLLALAVGAVGSTAAEVDRTEGSLSSGRDTATTTENEANYGYSFAGGLLGLFEFRFTLRLTQALNHRYRSRVFERIQSLPMRAFDDERIGDAVYRLMYDTPSITNACYRLLITPVAAVLGLLVTVWVVRDTVTGSPGIAWAALGFLPLAFLTALLFGSRARARSQASREAGALTTTGIEEGLANILAVQGLGSEAHEQQRFARESWASFGAFRRFVLTIALAIAFGAIPAAALTGYAFLRVTDLVIAGVLTPGDFALVFTYFFQIAGYAIALGSLWIQLQGAAAGLGRVFELMDWPAERDEPGARELPPVRRGIRVEDAHFEYADGTPALRGVSFEARVGEITALVGPVGSGKTTLVSLLPRFLDPSAGRVRIDDLDVADATLASLRARTAFVFQETVLFDASIEENLRLGRPDASDEEIRRAARSAGADDFVRALPDGYRTRLGRAGGKLSGGQKQRLAIARALVREAGILILDEPTSALDPESEARILTALHEAARTRVVIVVAHRLSSIRAADSILFLEHGRIIERGTHAELMSRPDGAYRRFVALQTLRTRAVE